jgi:hypothetical protein
MVDVFVIWSRIPLQKTLREKAVCVYVNSTLPVKELIFLNKCAAVNVPKVEGKMLACLFVLEEQFNNG